MSEPHQDPRPLREVFTVSRLNREVRALLEVSFPNLWIEGEISNLSRPASGHLYFSLKDANAQVRCAMFRMRNMHLPFRPEDGMQVLLRARIGLYEARGEYQLIVDHMEQAGDGALRRAFEALKQRLDKEGLFDSARKRPLPALPRCIGVVTSPTGAAIRDILTVLKRRFAAIPVVVYPVPVQGGDAGRQIAGAIRTAGERGECDVLIVGRGGGSLEDLWAFNEEPVARAIHGSPVPVVSAVGHEIDFTIADFVADRRAPTPSAAAELLAPDGAEWLARAVRLEQRLVQCTSRQFQRKAERLAWTRKRLKHPGRRLEEIAQRLDELDTRLARALRVRTREHQGRLRELYARLHRHTPLHRLHRMQLTGDELQRRLEGAMRQRLERFEVRLVGAARALDAVSPLATLSRGYAIVRRPDGPVVRSATELTPGEPVEARLGRGRLLCEVKEVFDES